MVLEPTYIEPTGVVELVKYEKIIGDTSDTSCEHVDAPTPPPRISFLLCEQEDNSNTSTNITSANDTNTSSSSKNSTTESDDDMFNVSVNHNILSRSFKRKDDSSEKIEPLFTINISIKNERNGVLIHRKFVV